MPNYLVIGGISRENFFCRAKKNVCKVIRIQNLLFCNSPNNDDEMYEKKKIHQDRRPKDWTKIEEQIDIVSRIMEIEETNKSFN
ncbi:MAG: hypothetical protein CM15mP73_0370 [Hyphomicrobiales bacterium]|nr:MAG: hypothetical protein CM15mP73_0370 [Hyphomicrobiales bacterium]